MSLTDERLASPIVETLSVPMPAMPAARAMPSARCPYCEHVSPQGSKFCNECGAALHLLPCPHCGAVNDISLFSVCARCDWDLRPTPGNLDAAANPSPAFAPDANPDTATAAAAASAAAAHDGADLPTDAAPALLPMAADRQPPSPPPAKWALKLTVGLLLIVVTAAVSTYTYMKRLNTEARLVSAALAGVAPEPASAAAPTSAPSTEAAGTVTAADSSTNANAVTAPATSNRRPVVARAARPAPDPDPDVQNKPQLIDPAAQPAAQQPKAGRASADIEPKPAVIGPCTDAIAALGLCTPETNTPRRQ